MAARAGGLVLGAALDALLADPARLHPVAGFGRAAGGLERLLYRDDRAAGALHTALLLAAVAVPAAVAERVCTRACGDVPIVPAAPVALAAPIAPIVPTASVAPTAPIALAAPVASLAPMVLTAAVTWVVLGGASLRRQGRRLGAE
ncbi:cobalamin biosynthesis protein, partial [Frankia sp. AiPs1]|uniref:cobalamin biosynthesis protein n=1 Tax=Frankia sp. AiPs1 TaxID=573493 RepID=UPI002044AC74